MSAMPVPSLSCEYILRVRHTPDGYACTIRQLEHCAHPEVRALKDPIARATAATAPAAMVAAIAMARIPEAPAALRSQYVD